MRDIRLGSVPRFGIHGKKRRRKLPQSQEKTAHTGDGECRSQGDPGWFPASPMVVGEYILCFSPVFAISDFEGYKGTYACYATARVF
jgi:hypothetical protein